MLNPDRWTTLAPRRSMAMVRKNGNGEGAAHEKVPMGLRGQLLVLVQEEVPDAVTRRGSYPCHPE